ncbi:MAG: heteromeric transposase endonuclease subunit TnsA [Burkholderiales bacterium]|nr:MAG: heteromeric transposase endonuclease subunit TnsA [Betaproteobacteria bacterium]TAG84368.1 MAG: heteromeric transposase endonuclease subunit TnsA [Burkholderiales bacterium]
MSATKPARKITTKSWTGVRGVTQEGQQYESMLENDFLTLLRFDCTVASYRTQPCQVAFRNGDKPHIYTPDVFVDYQAALCRSPELIEVKPAKFAIDPEEQLRMRFDAAAAFASERGWVFRVVTENDIPAGRLANARFLLRYRERTPDDAYMALALAALSEVETASIDGLLQMCQQHHENRARLLTELWTLIATRRIGADLDSELTMHSAVWCVEPNEIAI